MSEGISIDELIKLVNDEPNNFDSNSDSNASDEVNNSNNNIIESDNDFAEKNCNKHDSMTKLDMFTSCEQDLININSNIGNDTASSVIDQIFLQASLMGHIVLVEKIISHMLTKNYYNFDTCINKALCLASENGQLPTVELLLKNGASITYKNCRALKNAVLNGHSEISDFLIKNGSDIHVNEDELLLLCCKYGDNIKTMKILIENGINVFKHYNSALDHCLKRNYGECATELVRYSDANPSPKKIKYYEMIHSRINAEHYTDKWPEDLQTDLQTDWDDIDSGWFNDDTLDDSNFFDDVNNNNNELLDNAKKLNY